MYNAALEVNNLLQTVNVVKYLARRHQQESENKEKLTQKEKELLRNLQSKYSMSLRQIHMNVNYNVVFTGTRIKHVLIINR